MGFQQSLWWPCSLRVAPSGSARQATPQRTGLLTAAAASPEPSTVVQRRIARARPATGNSTAMCKSEGPEQTMENARKAIGLGERRMERKRWKEVKGATPSSCRKGSMQVAEGQTRYEITCCLVFGMDKTRSGERERGRKAGEKKRETEKAEKQKTQKNTLVVPSLLWPLYISFSFIAAQTMGEQGYEAHQKKRAEKEGKNSRIGRRRHDTREKEMRDGRR